MTDPAALVAALRATIGDLDRHIERRAAEVAAPRIAAVEAAAAARVAKAERDAAFGRQRSGDLVAELRRHLAARDRTIARLTAEQNRRAGAAP